MRAPEGMSHLCPNTSSRTLELELEMPFHRRPFAVDDAEYDGIALRAVRHELMVAQDGVLLGTQARDRLAGRMVEPVRAKLDRDASELFERVREQHQFAFGVDRGALRPPGVPGVADLQT